MKIGNYNRPPNRQLQYTNKIMDCKMKQTKPRSMHKVLGDIEFCINNDVDKLTITTDIHQLISQLTSVLHAVDKDDRKKAYEILNPAANYFKL